MKRRAFFSIFLTAVIVTATAPATHADIRARRLSPQGRATLPDFVPGEVLVKFKPTLGATRVEPLNGAFGLVIEDRLEKVDVARYRLFGGDVLDTVRKLRQRPDVLYAEPNYTAHLAMVPNDPLYANVGGFARDLQRWTFGGIDDDPGINAEAAWDITTGRPDVTIAIIDSGVWLTHGDLAPNIWTNPGEVPANGRDDDNNGFVDDVHGWDFYSGDSDANPDLGNGDNDDGVGIGDDNVFHGTFVANCAAGRGNDARGVCGAAWTCTIMPLKIFTDDGGANNFNIAASLQYAADNGADIINMSLETRTDSSTLRDGVAYATARDCVVVAAGGNGNSSAPVYPAAYPNVLSVGSSDHAFQTPSQIELWGPADFDGRAFFSEYGPQAIDVVAPGVLFSSSVASQTDADSDPDIEPGDVIGFSSVGTSFSAPIVAGLAGLLVSRDKDLNGGVRTIPNTQIIDAIQNTAQDLPDDPDDSPNGTAMWDSHGRVDFLAALQTISGGDGGRAVRLSWKAPTSGADLAAPTDLQAQDQSSNGRPPAPAGRQVMPGFPISGDTLERGAAATIAGGTVTEIEPNNSLATAQQVSVPTTVAGQIQTSDDGGVIIFYGDGTQDAIEDLYVFNLTQQSTVSITLTPNGAADLDLAMLTDLDGNGQYDILQEYLSANPATGPGQSESLTNLLLPAGTYYVGCSVYDLEPGAQSDAYSLVLSSGGAIVTGYRVYRAATPNVQALEVNRIAQVTAAQLSFVDTDAPDGALYYIVTATYASGESAPSNEATPGGVNPNAPSIINATWKKGKLLMTAAGSKILAGAVLVVDNSETFTLTPSADGSKWLVKKKARSTPGAMRIADAVPANKDVSLYVINPDGLRSTAVSFHR